eukprot:comp18640_c0_seq1/m.20249 comp18640_c0_seq1/g.20249  ORF comp18640_c0_seq1/g.20249 comp18640_c0_seq1/m.20249 type:complete len:157 (-) comp18640_c0_seq1:15-485(-)
MAGVNPILLEDIFGVKQLDPDVNDVARKPFPRVTRLWCSSENYEMDLLLDVNTELYPVELGDKFTIALATRLSEEGIADSGEYDPQMRATLADKFEYVMYGRVYRLDEEEKDKLAVYVSYGGLLMCLRGDARNLQGIEQDAKLYLLMRRVESSDLY